MLLTLKVFAHRTEAKEFLNKDSKFIGSESCLLYKGLDSYILISGEGLQNATEALSISIATLGNIKRVINYGICGAIEKKLPLMEIKAIRTCYKQQDSDIEFHSFSTKNKNAKLDIISTYKRIKNKEDVSELNNFAHLVDREAWALASVCNRFNINFYCYKLIADYCGQDNIDICKHSKDNIKIFSKKFHEFDSKLNIKEESKYLIDYPTNYYFTNYQKNQYLKMKKSLSLKFKNIDLILKDIDINKNLLLKERTNKLLEEMEKLLDPELFNKKEQLRCLIGKRKNIKYSFHPYLENTSVTINTSIENESQWNNLILQLKNFPYKKACDLIKGSDTK